MSEYLENRLIASTVLGHRVLAPSVNKVIYIFGETVNTCTISCSLRRYISHTDAEMDGMRTNR